MKGGIQIKQPKVELSRHNVPLSSPSTAKIQLNLSIGNGRPLAIILCKGHL